MATRSLLKPHSNVTSQFLRKPFRLTTPIAQSTVIDESLRLLLAEKSQLPPPSPTFFLSDFVGANQKLLVDEEGLHSARQCLQTAGSAVGGSLWARGRGGSSSSRKQIDSEEEFDDDNVVDEFDDDDDDLDEDLDEFDGKFGEDVDDDDEEEFDDKPRRKK
ncbi:prostatic spermine-binding protein [Neltuma alba]|uniref:prostatic spermine-binding protein-like n=1 Tax=Neltuma alba TaxID=207710 RepID=UPI0010A2B527|nr:prostatic spermine-binding protein-like [Prosopis alba]XP_028807510.1 prostatic spermine-binding protein [Prosopis alba]